MRSVRGSARLLFRIGRRHLVTPVRTHQRTRKSVIVWLTRAIPREKRLSAGRTARSGEPNVRAPNPLSPTAGQRATALLPEPDRCHAAIKAETQDLVS